MGLLIEGQWGLSRGMTLDPIKGNLFVSNRNFAIGSTADGSAGQVEREALKPKPCRYPFIWFHVACPWRMRSL